MSLNKGLLTLALGMALSACSTTKGLVKPPEKVYVEVEKIVAVPAKLTEPCAIEEPTELTVAEAVRVAKARKTSLQKCNEDKAKIRSLGK